jgi:HAD superfamily hydrolase (TIGR01549 family)
LIDIGMPIIDERDSYVLFESVVREVLSRELNRVVTDAEVGKARDEAIRSWAPSFTKAVLWHFLQPDAHRMQEIYMDVVERSYGGLGELSLTEGIAEVIPKLASKYVLALAGNQPSMIAERLERTGLLEFFHSRLVSEDIGFYKPDSRFFLAICDRIEVPPVECCMIGDRLDNDIYPANVLGMRTIWLRMGPHAVQSPRMPEDVPDAVIESIGQAPDVLDEWERSPS